MLKKIAGFLIALLFLKGITYASPVQVWSTFSQEQNKIYQELTDQYFTPETGIDVKITSIPYAGYEQKYLLAAISGDVPEVGVSGSLGPADLGVRGAAVDLRQRFGNEYEKVRNNMYPGLMRSFDFMGSAFGLPIQTNVYPMLVRTDILNQMGLSIPDTWNDLYKVLPKLHSQNRNFATAFGIGPAVYADISMFIWQKGGDIYSDDKKRSGLDSPEAIKAFTEFTELFTKYKIPMEINFFMDFTKGNIPLMIAPFWEYSSLVFGAPELKGKWTLSLVPGTISKDGSVNHAAYIGGETLILFKNAKCIDDGFKWVKWFLDCKIQSELAKLVPERIKGGMFIPANRFAMENLPLPQDHVKVIVGQAAASVAPAFALIPASITHRYFNFAANKAVLQGKDPEKAIREAAEEMNNELLRKQKEFERFISRL